VGEVGDKHFGSGTKLGSIGILPWTRTQDFLFANCVRSDNASQRLPALAQDAVALATKSLVEDGLVNPRCKCCVQCVSLEQLPFVTKQTLTK
jgi:hypothetical protein